MSGRCVCLISRSEPGTTGTSRYAAELARRLGDHGWSVTTLGTLATGRSRRALDLGRRVGVDLAAFLATYPLRVDWPAADVYHLSGQTYASALHLGRPPGPVIVTAHDIIPYILRHRRDLRTYAHSVHRAFDLLAMHGLRRADLLVADSEWTKRTLVEELAIDPARIEVVPLGIDAELYKRTSPAASLLDRYGLAADRRYVLYVGSEDPRKNLAALLRALAIVRRTEPDVVLLKVGAPHHELEHQALVRLSAEVGETEAIRWLGPVPEGQLPELYTLASVYVQPSLYEGFGLPVLEARACETPIVVSECSALPEVAPPDSLVPPTPEGLAKGILAALARARTPEQRRRLSEEASDVRRRFTWDAVARRTAALYERYV